MRLGYACLTVGVPKTNFKSCMLKNATDENLLYIIEHNLESLENIIDYNIKNNIKLFRISSDLIPFGSSDANTLPWQKLFSRQLTNIGNKIKSSGIRVSMHPGQYTVLNSPNPDVVSRAIKDLKYHNSILDGLGADIDSKIILHIGGVYGDKEEAINRFIENYHLLDKRVKQRLVVENDDKSYNIGDVLKIGKSLDIPVVFDNLHNEILSFDDKKDDKYWINQCSHTWKKADGPQKIHYSQQNPDKRPGAHSKTIDAEKFMQFIRSLDRDLDMMLEVKDKNLSAVKCNNCMDPNSKIKKLEVEWSKYKYNVLEHSPLNYNEIRKTLKNKNEYPVGEFYKLIEEALATEASTGNSINAAQHVWGYFKSKATDSEKEKFEKSLQGYEQARLSKKSLKNQLYKMALKYEEHYLLNSYYFYF